MTVPFPYNVKLQSVQFSLVGRGGSAGQGLSGATTTVSSNSAHWIATATFAIYGHEAFLAWQGFLAEMNGMTGRTLVPAWTRILPKDQNGHEFSRRDAVSVGGNSIADNTGFAQTEITHARLKSAAALRDSVIQAEYIDTTGIRPGHRIGIGNRCHDVALSYGETSGETTLKITPPLRQAYPANERIILDRPICEMRFETEREGEIAFDTRPAKSVTVNFREVY